MCYNYVMDVKRIQNYWLKNAELKWATAESLYDSEKYADSLFFYHLVIESLLKAVVVQHTLQPAPYTHDLVRLAELAELSIDDEKRLILQDITQFNLECRYPDEKFEFYKRATKDFAVKARKNIETIHLWLKTNFQ